MKPVWEEEWIVDYGDSFCEKNDTVENISTSDGDSIVKTDSGMYPPSRARAKLAAQAPAMARFIMAMRAQYDWETFPELDEVATPLLRAAGILP